MRFSIAALALGAAGAMAGVVTETLTEYTTYCPEATSIVHGSQTYSIATPGYITMTHGPYTVTRPVSTSTVTECKSCSAAAAVTAPVVASSVPLIPVAPTVATSTPLVPSAGSTGVPSSPSSPSSAATPSQPAFNAGAINAATGAGAGLAAVFGVVALML
ncbi:hypothetical protein LT330_004305 [Penicillium expansum]|uniref:Clock-controlled protein 6 n=1 Tax=Penicillium expansum TaxID=27334 RepID=A0A0A2K4E8_PENEN|nr:hypothetical protein PEX2_045800 [Penicillium expansum]KAK4861389.1 hypothetical protein LT330_004305 [Penicillium expansum]KGO62554.1 hypothetical protein PEX2_045800 [Penicillium expansum]